VNYVILGDAMPIYLVMASIVVMLATLAVECRHESSQVMDVI